jgi:hypothetical protein
MSQNPKRSRTVRATALALLVAASGTGLYACRQEKKGPLESAGEKIDEHVDDKRAVEDAKD